MPKNEHTDTNNTAFSFVPRFTCRGGKGKKKKDRPADPPDFQAKGGGEPFIFLGLIMFISNPASCINIDLTVLDTRALIKKIIQTLT